MQNFTIADTQTMTVQAAPVDGAGAPGVLAPGAVASWASNVPAVATVVTDLGVDPSGRTATVTPVAPGTCTITCSDQNPAGPFSGGFTLTVTGGNAVGFVFTFAIN